MTKVLSDFPLLSVSMPLFDTITISCHHSFFSFWSCTSSSTCTTHIYIEKNFDIIGSTFGNLNKLASAWTNININGVEFISILKSELASLEKQVVEIIKPIVETNINLIRRCQIYEWIENAADQSYISTSIIFVLWKSYDFLVRFSLLCSCLEKYF